MKPSLLLLAGLTCWPASAQTITNINIGIDSNSVAWGKVNQNNNNFVAWWNAERLTNAYFYGALTNLGPAVSNTFPTLVSQSNRLNQVQTNLTAVSAGLLAVSNNCALAGSNLILISNDWLRVSNQLNGGRMNFDSGRISSDGGGVVRATSYVLANPEPLDGIWGEGGGLVDDFGVNLVSGPQYNSAFDGAWLRIDTRSESASKMLASVYYAPAAAPGTASAVFSVGADGGTAIGAGLADQSPPSQGLAVAGQVGVGTASPAYALDVQGTLGADYGQIYSDGNGNLAASSFNPLSDRALKENVAPLPGGAALDMVMSLTNYQWNFRARTNFTLAIQRHWITNPAGTGAGVVWFTNRVPRPLAAGPKEFGPMAQEWHAVTGLGDGTRISATAMQGLLLGAVQDLNQKLDGASGRPGGGLIFPPHTWDLAAITNHLPNFGFWTGNSNGGALVTVWVSNGAVRIKQLAP